MISSGAHQETNIAKNIWRKVMAAVHEDLPDKDFYVPTGIVRSEICIIFARSFKDNRPIIFQSTNVNLPLYAGFKCTRR
jgi:membrane carboxypeptidase/penicillin-binding protein